MRWRLYTGIVSVFALGGVAGAIVGVTGERDRIRKSDAEGLVPAMETMSKRLETELKLDPGQARRIKEIYASTRPQLLQIERERRRRIRLLMETTQPPIVDILTPQQKERFKELQQKLQFRLRLRDTTKENEPHQAPPPPQT